MKLEEVDPRQALLDLAEAIEAERKRREAIKRLPPRRVTPIPKTSPQNQD